VISLTEAQLMAWISPIIWPFLRVLAVFTAAPIFSTKAFPVRARIALAFFIAIAAGPSLEGQAVVSVSGPDALFSKSALGCRLALLFASFSLPLSWPAKLLDFKWASVLPHFSTPLLVTSQAP
jgi:flagellar biosynthetic protein FliR